MNGGDRRYALAALPATLFLLVLFVVPIGMVLAMSLTGASPLGSNYLRIFTAPVYLVVLANTLSVGLGVTLVTLILAYPLAYLLSTLPARTATVLLGIVILPWFTSLLVRSYAWMILLGQSGVVNSAFKAVGLIDRPLPLLYSAFGVYVATVHILLPYMVLTLYGTMQGIDLRLVKAAQAAGASPPRAFFHVYLPLSLPGVVGGCLLVFIMAIGFYVTPALLGSPRQMMIAQMIASEMLETLQWGFGGALAVVLLTVTFAALALFVRLFGVARLMGSAR